MKPEFEDVKKCKTMEELNEFIRQYLDKNELKGEARKKLIGHFSTLGGKSSNLPRLRVGNLQGTI